MSAISVHRLTNRPLLQGILFFSLLGAYIILLVRTAWMCDDAFITLRTVDNFVQGYGLVWNIGERVQAYTHPLWMFLLSAFYAFTREPYFTTLAISMALSLATVVLLLWTGRHHLFTLLLIGIISIGSKAFADYSTSGLENPLAHLLLVAFFVLCLRQPPHPRYAFPLGALAGLIMLNRLDHGVLVIPALLAAAIQLPRRAAVTLLAAAGAPVAGWLLFSLVYYGFPFPNTFYAKQTLGIPRIEYLQRGVSYVADTAVVDGVTLLGITFAVGWAVWRRSVLALLSAAAGILLYVLYVVWIGGDFMGGRMFSAPLAASLAVLASAKPTNYRYPNAILAILFTTALVLLNRPYLTSPEPLRGAFTGSIEQAFLGKPPIGGLYGIVDERQFYSRLWLLPIMQGQFKPEQHPWASQGISLRENKVYFSVRGPIGMFGYYAGQQAYIIDELALSDAFLARIGLLSIPDNWRIAHVPRPMPEGYILTKFTGENKIIDTKIKNFYNQLQFVISGPTFNIERFKYIFNINTTPLPISFANSSPYEAFRNLIQFNGVEVKEKGINIILGARVPERRLFFRAQGSYEIEVRGSRGSAILSRHPIITDSKKVTVHHIELAEEADLIRLLPLNGESSKVYLALTAPRKHLDPEVIKTNFVTLNAQVPRIRNHTDYNLANQPLWLINYKRGLPMLIKARSKAPHILEVKATPVCPPDKAQVLRLWLNGQLLAEHEWVNCGQPWEAQIPISAGQILDGWNLLEAEAEHGVVPAEVFPGNNDRRTLFVAFHRLWVRPTQ
jgi:arabinofuranosyltransferase